MKRNRKSILALTLCLLTSVAAGCDISPFGPTASEESSSGVSSVGELPPTPAAPAGENTDISALSLEQKVGQMFFLCFRKEKSGADILTCTDSVRRTLQFIRPGGIILFGENIRSVEQVRGLIGSMKAECSIPPFVGVDQEGGTVQRITRTPQIPATVIPPMQSVAKTGSIPLAHSIGQIIASELTVFGFNLDFAPDCDVLTDPKNTSIGTRSFSGNAETVAAFSAAVADGIREEGIIPVCKHFPGLGGASADTHDGSAEVGQTIDELHRTELVPFRQQIASGDADMIMVGHISLPKINEDDTPASLSPKVITGLLRGELRFGGVVITDSLSMGAVTKRCSSGQAAVLAVQAGADMLLTPEDPDTAFQAVLGAVRNGEITESRIDASVTRILTLKRSYHLSDKKELGDVSLLGSAEHRAVVGKVG